MDHQLKSTILQSRTEAEKLQIVLEILKEIMKHGYGTLVVKVHDYSIVHVDETRSYNT